MRVIPDLDLARIRAYCDARVPVGRRGDARVEVLLRGRSATILDCRPPWHPELTEWSRLPVAQLRYDPVALLWTLYYADRNGRWHPYDLIAPGALTELLAELDDDPTGIFWG